MDKLTPKAVIFDLGSTLIEYEVVSWDELTIKCAASTYTFMQQQGFEIPEEQEYISLLEEIRKRYRDQARATFVEYQIPDAARELLNSLGIDYQDDLIDRFFEAYYLPVAEQLYVYDDTIATLIKLREQVPIIGLVSNTIFPEKTHLNELKRFGIEPYLDFKLFSSTFGLRKPHRDIFLKAANLAGFAPGECVYIGDRYIEDIEGPSGVGMPAVLKVKKNRDYPSEMPLASRQINSLAELSDHVLFE